MVGLNNSDHCCYGDLASVTTMGRIIAVGLMLCGITLLGIITATTASWLVDKFSQHNETDTAVTTQQLQALSTEIAHLRAELAEHPR